MKRCLFGLGCLLAALMGCAKKVLPTPATPWADVVHDSLSFLTTITDPEGLRVCYVFDWGDGSTTTTGYFASGDTGYCSHEFADTRVRHIRVKARNEKSAESGWSPSLQFHASQSPQMADTIFGLRCWAVDRWYHASVRVTDPDADSVSVKFVWDDAPAAEWSAFVPSGSLAGDSCKWSAVGPHTLRVFLKDKGCTVSRPAAVKTIGISRMAVTWYNCSEQRHYNATPTLGSIDGEPVIYCLADEGIDCYNLDGNLRWTAGATSTGYCASLSPDGARLYLSGYDALVCLDSRTGRRKWILPLDTVFDGEADCTPALGPDGAIYVTLSGYCEYDLAKVQDHGDSAAFQWLVRAGSGGPVADGAVVDRSGVVYALGYKSFYGNRLLAVDSTGTTLWIDTTTIPYGGVPVIDSRNRLVIADGNGHLFCFNPDGSLAWNVSTSGLFPGSTAVGPNDEVIATDMSGTVRTFDAAGNEQWSLKLNLQAMNTPCVTDDGSIIAYDPRDCHVYEIGSDGQTLWDYSIPDSLGIGTRRARTLDVSYGPSAVIGPNGDLYLESSYGLFCLSGTNLRMANTAWPTYNHDNARSGWAGRH